MSELRRLCLADIALLGDKETIPSFKAMVTKIEPSKSDTGQYGPYTVQKIWVKDGTGESKVDVWDHDDFTNADIGEERLFECSNNGKGLAGIRMKVDEFIYKKGPKEGQKGISRAISVGKQAEISRIGSAIPDSKPAKAEPPTTAPTPEKSPISQIRTVLGQQANSLSMCFDAALYVAAEVFKKHQRQLASEDIRAMAIHMNMSLNDRFLTTNIPSGPLDKKEPPKEDMRALWLKLAGPAADSAIAFAIHRGWLIEPTDTLAQWPEQHLPKNQSEAVKLLAEIQDWTEMAHNPLEPEDDTVPF